MKKQTAIVLIATTMGGIASVHAQEASSRLYAEIGYTKSRYTENDPDPVLPSTIKLRPGAVSGIVGYQFMPNWAVEGLVGIGVGSGKVKATLDGDDVPNDAKAKVKYTLGWFIKPSFAVNERVELFGRLGWVRQKLEVSVPTETATVSTAGVAYGVGANFNLSKKSYIQASWMTYFEDNKPVHRTTRGVTVAYGMRF